MRQKGGGGGGGLGEGRAWTREGEECIPIGEVGDSREGWTSTCWKAGVKAHHGRGVGGGGGGTACTGKRGRARRSGHAAGRDREDLVAVASFQVSGVTAPTQPSRGTGCVHLSPSAWSTSGLTQSPCLAEWATRT